MLRDSDHRQAIQKFSFIQSLNLSRGIDQDEAVILAQMNAERLVSPSKPDQIASLNQDGTAKTATTKINSPSAIVTKSENNSTINADWYQSELDSYSLNLAEIIKYSTPENSPHNNPRRHPNYLGKILFALACSYSLFVLWWLFGNQASKLMTTLKGGRQIVMSKADAQFIDYLERSLDIIEREVEANQASTGSDESLVYIPVYTPTPATPSVPQISPANLPRTSLPSNNTAKIPEPVAIAKPEPLKIPAPPPLPNPTSDKSNTVETQPTAASNTAQATAKHTLTGILDLGENKAALVKVNGGTRRIGLGEEINNNGWILESVANQSAKFSYQGQVRSITVGEKF